MKVDPSFRINRLPLWIIDHLVTNCKVVNIIYLNNSSLIPLSYLMVRYFQLFPNTKKWKKNRKTFCANRSIEVYHLFCTEIIQPSIKFNTFLFSKISWFCCYADQTVYPHASKESWEVANFIKVKNTCILCWRFVCLNVCLLQTLLGSVGCVAG